jgi:hypothetical protein
MHRDNLCPVHRLFALVAFFVSVALTCQASSVSVPARVMLLLLPSQKLSASSQRPSRVARFLPTPYTEVLVIVDRPDRDGTAFFYFPSNKLLG